MEALLLLRRKVIVILVRIQMVLDQARGQDGWILAKLFFNIHLGPIKHAKKKMIPISRHHDQTSLVNKGFIMWDKTPKMIFDLVGPSKKYQAGKISPSPSAWVDNHRAGFGSSCPLKELVI